MDADAHVSPAIDPETAAIDRELVDAARAVLGSLSGSDQETLMATFADERPTEVSTVAFRKRRERALGRLKSAWRRIHAD